MGSIQDIFDRNLGQYNCGYWSVCWEHACACALHGEPYNEITWKALILERDSMIDDEEEVYTDSFIEEDILEDIMEELEEEQDLIWEIVQEECYYYNCNKCKNDIEWCKKCPIHIRPDEKYNETDSKPYYNINTPNTTYTGNIEGKKVVYINYVKEDSASISDGRSDDHIDLKYLTLKYKEE